MRPAVNYSCPGKERFETHKLAMQVATRWKKTERPRGVYRCHVCEGYHLGGGEAERGAQVRSPAARRGGPLRSGRTQLIATNTAIAYEPPPVNTRVDYWLNQWAVWYRAEPTRLGFPHRTIGLVGGGESRRGEEWEEDESDKIWHRNCEAMDALIESLPPSQCAAVRNAYIGEPWCFPRENREALLEAATVGLLRGMNARAVL